MGYWSIIVPEATINYEVNPSFEAATTGYTDHATGTASGSRARSSAWSKRGVWSYLITKSGGGASDEYGFYENIDGYAAFLAGEYATFGLDLNVVSGTVQIKLQVTAGTTISQTLNVTASGRYSVTVGPIVGTVTEVRISAYVVSATGSFYADGIQVERKAYATTYCDGTREGCSWAGSPHASTSSRLSTSRAGGREINLDSYTVYVTENQGIGVPPIRHLTQNYALLPGALYRGHTIQPRSLTLMIMPTGSSLANLHSLRKALWDAIKPDAVSPEQAFILRYTGANASKAAEISVVYDDGLGFGAPDGFAEDINLRLIAYDPLWYEDGEASAVLDSNTSVASVNYIARKVNGAVAAMGTGLAKAAPPINANVIRRGPDGKIYVGGYFDSVNGVANTQSIAAWDPATATWSAVGTGDTGSPGAGLGIFDLQFDAAGNLYVVGNFSQMGGAANTSRIAKWDGSTWSSVCATAPTIGAGVASIRAIAIHPLTGDLYVTGNFTAINGGAANYIAKRVGTTWSAVGSSGLNATGYKLVFAPNGTLYVAGSFTTADGITVCRVAQWNGAAFSAMGDGSGGGAMAALLVARDGSVYVSGNFTTLSGVAANYIAQWNGTAFEPLGDGLNNYAYALQETDEGHILAGGIFTSAGSLTLVDQIAEWNGSTWSHFDIDFPGSAEVLAMLHLDAQNAYYSFNTSGTMQGSGQTTVTNNGTRTAYPKIEIKRSGGTTASALWLRNETTGETLWLNYSLQDGETLTIDLTPGKRSCVSSLFGSRWNAILQSSDIAAFGLIPGANVISCFVSESGSPTVTASMTWRVPHWAADGVAA